MELNMLENKKNRMVFELKGESHAFCNALKKELWNVDGITVSGYTIEHPMIGIPRFTIETTGKAKPKDAILKAVKKLKKQNKEFLKKFEKEVK